MKKILHLPRKTAKVSCYLLLLLIIGNVSCRKKKCRSTIAACAAFSDSFFDSWFPYTTGQEVIFRSTAGAEKKLTIREQYKSTEVKESTYEYECNSNTLSISPVSPSEQCPNASIHSSLPTNNTVGFRIAYSSSGGELMLHIDTTILYATSLQDTGIVNIRLMGRSRSNSTKFYPSYVFNGTNYDKVQVITRDTIADRNAGVYKIVLAQGLGVLEYGEYPSHTSWKKQ
jgi:membrane-bound inhibitor of C-type lysozyme